MKIFMEKFGICNKFPEIAKTSLYWLESFVYFDDWMVSLLPHVKEFILDSGAFTFMSHRKGKEVDFETYLRQYIAFINKHDIKNFFEIDIDKIVGLEKVEQMRATLERETGKRCIPVWHKSRGLQYFRDITEEYSRIAIGGLAIKDISKSQWPYLRGLLDIAHSNKCQVHGLGFTSLKELKDYQFDSVDSSSWNSGGRFGQIYEFTGNSLIIHQHKSCRIKDYRAATLHNFKQWVLYQKYMDTWRG